MFGGSDGRGVSGFLVVIVKWYRITLRLLNDRKNKSLDKLCLPTKASFAEADRRSSLGKTEFMTVRFASQKRVRRRLVNRSDAVPRTE